MLQKEEVLRYSRQVNLSDVGMAGQLKFKKAKVLIVGAGGLGCPIFYLVVFIRTPFIPSKYWREKRIFYNTTKVKQQKAIIRKNYTSIF